jgi:cytochrome c oxidase assembly protein subunit 15
MKKFRTLLRIELILIYLVIIAGSVVRMTGSGMGCPDWPKCFGYLIPPTERAQLEWQADKTYQKGQIIIVEESLRVANNTFTTNTSYNPQNWSPYTKHDYAHFNAFHTWTEYVNRLIGALAGIPMFLLFVLSLFYLRRKPLLPLLAFGGLFMLGFEAWLGKLVVDGNLIPGSITIHMLGALVIVALLLIFLSRVSEYSILSLPAMFKGVLWIALTLGLLQIILGTQVREQVDILHESGLSRANWIDQLDWHFYVHRSTSILILLLNLWLWLKGKGNPTLRPYVSILMLVILAEIGLGILLNYVSFPKLAQPAHLLLGTAMFGLQVHLLCLSYQKTHSLA